MSSQAFDSKSRVLGELLGSLERRVIVVPRFQRGFSWEKQHVATFWSDVAAFRSDFAEAPKSATYFFGPVVVQNQKEEILLLDGQQRMATATILLAVLRDAARALKFIKGQPGHDLAHEIQASVIQKEDSDPPFALVLSELDSEYFRRTIQSDPPDQIEPKLRSHELIRSAYRTLRDAVDASVGSLTPEQAVVALKQIKDAVTKGVLVVAISVESEDDAYSIFETLNDRGLRLSVPDLLLNLLMRRAVTETDREEVRRRWNYMLEQMGRRDIARFIRHMWLSRYGDLKARSLFNELKDYLATNKVASDDFASSCSTDCDYYIALVDASKEIPKAARNSVVGLVRYMGITSSLPLLLAGLQCLSDPEFAELARIAAALAVRYSIVADLNPSTLESAFYEGARLIRALEEKKTPGKAILAEVRALLVKLNPPDLIVAEKAKAVVLERGPAVWLVAQLANHMQSATKEIAVADANLEHIFPRNATVSQWPNKSELETFLWQLGNLTILGEDFNRSASNKAFAVKVGNYYKNSELVMTKDLIAYPAWTPAALTKRGEDMAGYLVKTFIV